MCIIVCVSTVFFNELNCIIDFSCIFVAQVVKETHTEVESSEDEIPIIKRVKIGREKRKGKCLPYTLNLAQAAKQDVPEGKDVVKARVVEPSGESMPTEKVLII